MLAESLFSPSLVIRLTAISTHKAEADGTAVTLTMEAFFKRVRRFAYALSKKVHLVTYLHHTPTPGSPTPPLLPSHLSTSRDNLLTDDRRWIAALLWHCCYRHHPSWYSPNIHQCIAFENDPKSY